MTITPWFKHMRRAFCAGTLALAVIGVSGNVAFAQAAAANPTEEELEDHVLNADKRLLNSILGAFGLAPNDTTIIYRERSPLVVPQGRDLPPPGKVAKGPDWPVEPEIKARKRESAELRSTGRKGQAYDASRPISGTPEVWRNGDTGTWTDEKKAKKEPDFFTMLWQGKLGGTWEEYGKFEGEPERRSLAQPPAGYLTPSPAAPYGTTPRAGEPVKKEKL